MADPHVTISYAVDGSVVPDFNVCNKIYSFEIAVAVNPMTSNQRDGEFNYEGENCIHSVDHVMTTISCLL